MAQKVPPPPQLTGPQWQSFNRWLLEVTSILSNTGGIDPSEVTGLPAVIAQVGTNTTDISDLESGQGGNSAAITALQTNVTGIFSSLSTINGQLTTLEANPVVRNGSGVPAAGLGNVNDWYADTNNKHIYVKTAATVWTLIL